MLLLISFFELSMQWKLYTLCHAYKNIMSCSLHTVIRYKLLLSWTSALLAMTGLAQTHLQVKFEKGFLVESTFFPRLKHNKPRLD